MELDGVSRRAAPVDGAGERAEGASMRTVRRVHSSVRLAKNEVPVRRGSHEEESRTLPRRDQSCAACGLPMTGQFVRALGGVYHLDCFRCAVRIPTNPGL